LLKTLDRQRGHVDHRWTSEDEIANDLAGGRRL
jgi:hypothetical protein